MRLPGGGHTSSDPQTMDECSDPVTRMTRSHMGEQHTHVQTHTGAHTRTQIHVSPRGFGPPEAASRTHSRV